MYDDYKRLPRYLYTEQTLKSEICEFQTCFLPDLFCIITEDIHNTMRPFNLDRVNTVKNPVRLSGKTELTPFEKEIQRTLVQPTHKQNGHTHCWPWSELQKKGGRGKGTGVNPAFTMQTTFLSAEHRVYSHSYRKPMSTTMADLITSQVHSTHAITLEATGGKKRQQNNRSETGGSGRLQQCTLYLFIENSVQVGFNHEYLPQNTNNILLLWLPHKNVF